MAEVLLAIDGNSLIHRAYWALPTNMKDKEGRHTNAVYGFFTMLFRIIDEYAPSHVVVAFDMKEKTFRHDTFAEYKAGRRQTPDDLNEQFPLLRDALAMVGIGYIEQERYEADDILGALAKQAEAQKLRTYIFTGDKDELQLIDDNISVVLTKKGVSETKLMNKAALMEEMGLTPLQITDLKGLMGDASDNIPGVAGVGEKTALKLLHEYQTIENLYEHIEELPKNKMYEKLLNGRESAVMSKKLATIESNMPLKQTLDGFTFSGFDLSKMRSMCEKYDFGSFLKRFEMTKQPPKEIKRVMLGIDEFEIFDDAVEFAFILQDGFRFAIDDETEYVIPQKVNLIDDGYDLDEILKAIAPHFKGKSVIAHDIKAYKHLFAHYNIELKDYFDTMVAEWVLNPSYSKYDLPIVMQRNDMQVCTADLFALCEVQRQKIQETELEEVLYDIEFPLIEVLYQMESNGFCVSDKELEALGIKYDALIAELTKNIYELAGMQFNISSPKQLAEVLFERLQLPSAKKTKTGYSTNIDVLEKLADKHPIIPYIMEYRTLSKLKGTYVDGLRSLIRSGMVHTTFLQAQTATGRLSSIEPNLQNIPIKTAMASDIRNAFYAPDGFTIVSADYSQIELRILADIADDENLKEAFLKGEDIHARTAAEILNKDIGDITQQERSSAKAVNFGIVYGISDFGLARNTGISRKQAGRYIERYFEEFSGVQLYMKEIVKKAHEDGFVRTICGRIRYIPELQSSNFNIRSAGERAALNTPIQGSAADIIKIAMNKVYAEFLKKNYQSKLILQVHDELIVYAKNEEIEEVIQTLKDCMQQAVKLSVPLEVNTAQGHTWAEAK
ncbi:MAG: DNA polymerase I [Christensenellaceae bacterium]